MDRPSQETSMGCFQTNVVQYQQLQSHSFTTIEKEEITFLDSYN